jgi:hypothetical protein
MERAGLRATSLVRFNSICALLLKDWMLHSSGWVVCTRQVNTSDETPRRPCDGSLLARIKDIRGRVMKSLSII